MAKGLLEDEADEDSVINERITIPKRSHRWVWILILLIVVAGAAWYVLRNRPAKVVVTDYASCVSAGGSILESFPEQCSISGTTFPNPEQKAPVVPNNVGSDVLPAEPAPEPKLAAYSDGVNIFSLQYPADFIPSDAEVLAPYSTSTITVTSKKFTHSIPVQHCNAKGDCTPTTTDMSFTLSVVNSSVDTISKSKKIPAVSDITFGSNKFKYFTQGVEGEGMYYYFISLPNRKTLMVSRSYIDESILTKYQTEKDFIKKADQDKLIEQILASLSFEIAPPTAN